MKRVANQGLHRFAGVWSREDSAGRPDLVLVDGGLTQVRAAREALAEAGVADVPVAGLAKRFEEHY